MENDEKDVAEDPDLHQQLSETHLQNLVAGQNQQQGAVAERETRASRESDPETEVGMDWPHPTETGSFHHTPGPDLEPPGEAEERKAQKQLEAGH